MSFRLVDENLVDHFQSNPDDRKNWLLLEPHPEFIGRWLVEGFDSHFYYDLHEIVGSYRQVGPANLREFMRAAEDLSYKVAFFEDPTPILDELDRLNDPPVGFAIESSMPDTIGGLFPFQLQAFNYLRDLDSGIVRHSTGTGKTVVACALLKHHVLNESFDVAWFVVRAHNKINTKRSLKALVDLDSLVIQGTKKARAKQYEELAQDGPSIAITNYEKFKFDKELIFPLFDGTKVLCIYDEMPIKLSSRKSALYKSVCELLYCTKPPAVKWEKRRPAVLKQYMLSATPVKTDPESFFNCARLLDGGQSLGTVKEFRDEFVASYSFFDQNKPDSWHKLDKMGLKIGHMVHQVDRDKDPAIAKLFPERLEEPLYIDWDEKHRKVYDLAASKALEWLDETNMLSLIGVLQMLCDAPSMLNNSAALREAYEKAYEKFAGLNDPWAKAPAVQGSSAALAVVTALGQLSDVNHTKMETLKMLLTEKHRSEKAVVFSAFNEGLLPIIERWFSDWGVTYVRYEGSPKQKQAHEDAFRNNPDIQVFLSSDQGSDSINLPEASVVIDYDLPWGSDTKKQRNRHDRITSTHQTIRRYHLLMEDSVEDRKKQIIDQKQAYHDGLFGGILEDQVISTKLSRDDLMFILSG